MWGALRKSLSKGAGKRKKIAMSTAAVTTKQKREAVNTISMETNAPVVYLSSAISQGSEECSYIMVF